MNEYDYLRQPMNKVDKAFMVILVSLFLLSSFGITILGLMGWIK